MTNTELYKTKEIVSKVINTLEPSLPFNIKDADVQVKEQLILIADSGRFNKYINNLFVSNSPSIDFEESIIQYRNFDRAKELLTESCLSFSALSNYSDKEQDVKEYEHFYELTKTNPRVEFINQQKQNHFITCLTYKRDDKRFWDEYTSGGNGVAVEFSIRNKHSDELFDFREVCYDDGSKFILLAEMQEKVFASTGKYILIDDHSKFASFYKRDNFSWENEKRMFFDITNRKANLPNGVKLLSIKDKLILKVPFINDFFEAKIKSIKFGSELPLDNKLELLDIIKQNHKGINVYDYIN